MSADFEVFCMGLFCGLMGAMMTIGAFAWVDDKVTKRQCDKHYNGGGSCNECDRQHSGVDRDSLDNYTG